MLLLQMLLANGESFKLKKLAYTTMASESPENICGPFTNMVQLKSQHG